MRPLTNTTPLLPGFSCHIWRKKPLSAQQKLAKELAVLQEKSFKQIGEIFEKFVPRKQERSGAMSRTVGGMRTKTAGYSGSQGKNNKRRPAICRRLFLSFPRLGDRTYSAMMLTGSDQGPVPLAPWNRTQM